jgi:hypothetical protein
VILQRDSRWGQPCLAHNLQARFPARAACTFADAQASLSPLSAPLCLIPAAALHVSIEDAAATACTARWPGFATPFSALALVRELRYPSLEVEDLLTTMMQPVTNSDGV